MSEPGVNEYQTDLPTAPAQDENGSLVWLVAPAVLSCSEYASEPIAVAFAKSSFAGGLAKVSLLGPLPGWKVAVTAWSVVVTSWQLVVRVQSPDHPAK